MLPLRFTEQSIQSLQDVQNHSFQHNQQETQQIIDPEQYQETFRIKMQPITLKPNREETTVAACDTSTIKIGETITGILIAVRGANVWKQSKNYHYTRLGPFIFHITETNKKEVHQTLERAYFDTPDDHNHQSFINLLQMPTRIANLLERWLQSTLAKTISNGLILFDGSLTAGTSDTPIHRMKEILTHANRRNNTVLAFSKMTNLRVDGYLITDIPTHCKPPYLLETTGLRTKPPTLLFGDVYVARLGHEDYAFRLDIDKQAYTDRKIRAVEKLLGNDVLSQGYPETLRLAHILCTFTANEVLAMQHFAVRRFGLRLIDRPDMHRLLFGPFGRGECYS